GFGIGAHDNQIGDPTNPARANTISGNGGPGVLMMFAGSDPFNNSVRGNSIYGNSGLGIDLGGTYPTPDGVTANDLLDADTGPNGLQNTPLLTQSLITPTGTVVQGTFGGAANQTFTLDFYENGVLADPSGHGEGLSYLGSMQVTTDASGNASFTASFAALPLGESIISATATDSAGNTSEFSNDVFPLSPNSLPATQVGQNYSLTITTEGGTAPFTFALTAGSLPAGVTLSPTGVLSGTPTADGTFNFTVTATDSNATAITGSQSY